MKYIYIYIDDVLIIRASLTGATGTNLYTLSWNGYLKKVKQLDGLIKVVNGACLLFNKSVAK